MSPFISHQFDKIDEADASKAALRRQIAEYLLALRKQKGVTQLALAKTSGIPQANLSPIEAGSKVRFWPKDKALLAEQFLLGLPDVPTQ